MVGGRQGAARGGKARAMAMRWMVALVEPPVTMTRRTAFSKACIVMMSHHVYYYYHYYHHHY